MIATAKEVTQTDFMVEETDRRPGDPAMLVGSSEKARQVLGWQPEYANLSQIIDHAWQWHQKRHR
jgi:UDP-glucose 4-epimerase